MPFGAIAGGLAAGIGGSLVSGLMSPSVSGGTNGSGGYYVPTGLGTADQTWQGLLQSLGNSYYANANPQNQIAQGSENAGINAAGAYAPGYQAGGNAAGSTSSYLASDFGNQAIQNWGVQQELLNAGNQVYQNSLDPQSALYNRTAQQLQDQTGATNSMYGLGSSAAGAGVANQAMSNFNIDWNAQQLQNQIAGLGAFAGAANTAGNYGQLADSQASMIPGYEMAGGQLPYNTAQTIAATPGSLASTYGQYLNSNLYGPAEGIQNQVIPYMYNGNGAQSVPFQSQSAGAGALGSMVSQGIQGLGTAYQNAGSLGNLFNGTTGSFGSGDFSGAFTSSPYYSGGGNSYGFTM